MGLIKEMLEICSAGINFRSAQNCKLVAEIINSHCSATTIDRQNNHFHHLEQCVTNVSIFVILKFGELHIKILLII